MTDEEKQAYLKRVRERMREIRKERKERIESGIKREECFAYRIDSYGIPYCSALRYIDCQKCSFFKTKEEYECGEKMSLLYDVI